LIPEIIKRAKKLYASLHFDYYLILYKIKFKNIKENEFNKCIGILIANNYSDTKLLYLKVLFYSDTRNFSTFSDAYIKMRKENTIEPGFRKKIVFQLLKKSNLLSKKQILFHLGDWNIIGMQDHKTNILLKNKRILGVLKSNNKLKQSYLQYTGIRRNDDDEDGDWEQYFEYKNGIVIKRINDRNQDGLYESQVFFFDNGDIKECFLFDDNNLNFRKFIFNAKDQSLVFIEYYNNNELLEKITLIQSSYYPKISILKTITNKSILPYIAYKEKFSEGHSVTNYFHSKIEYKFIDANNNKIFEEKIFYKNGIINEVLKDINEDGNFEIHEKYESGNLKHILYKTDESLEGYDYKEQLLNDRIIKFWDYNSDNIFEIAVEELNNGIIYKKFDINYDGKYDYVYELDGDVIKRVYRVSNKEKIIIKEFYKQDKLKQKKWNVVSVNDLDMMETPDDVIVEDKKTLSGIYFYKGNKYFFTNGFIKNESFSYRLFFINDIIYLFDIR
ncbi:MAG: hypothetical protein KAT05_17840, partial [Spirochaetes bacterium]|nr:hypothetical protein [Spirochaetota bacterium]